MRFVAAGVIALSYLSGLVWAAGDLNDDFNALKAAVEKKDAAQVKALAPAVSKESKEALAKSDTSKEVADFAKGADEYSEYALAVTAAQVPASTVELGNLLLEQNPKSQYVDTMADAYIAALARQSPAKAAAGAQKVLAAVKPPSVSDADWEKRKTMRQGYQYYYSGIASATAQRWADTDRNLKAAEPLIKGNPQMLGVAYFYLGVANYQMGRITADRTRMQAALAYSKQSAAIAGPMQGQANTNVAAIQNELGGRR